MEEKYLHLEDVFVTGILADNNNVTRVNVPEFKNNANRNCVYMDPVLLKGQLQGHTAMLAARQERGERGK